MPLYVRRTIRNNFHRRYDQRRFERNLCNLRSSLLPLSTDAQLPREWDSRRIPSDSSVFFPIAGSVEGLWNVHVRAATRENDGNPRMLKSAEFLWTFARLLSKPLSPVTSVFPLVWIQTYLSVPLIIVDQPSTSGFPIFHGEELNPRIDVEN